MLTNGRILQLYKVVFAQPIDSKMVFEINLSNVKASHAPVVKKKVKIDIKPTDFNAPVINVPTDGLAVQ